ncbi:MAG: transposase [Anaerolineaceae bacterium]|nr:transposase [Anaerolineaceae bacterium]
MPTYKRSRISGGTYFFTIVTYQRKPILVSPQAREVLRYAWKDVQKRFPFTTDAICLLPEHIHIIMTLPENDHDFSKRISEIKRLFSRRIASYIDIQKPENHSRMKRRESAVWQRRFWEHTIRDEIDLQHHMNYVHYNPVKHGLVQNVCDYPWSSFHRYVKLGYYEREWGSDVNTESFIGFGE